MAKTKLTHVLPDGTIATRTTARSYGFVVIAQTDFRQTRSRLTNKAAYEAHNKKIHHDNFKFFSDCIKAGPEGTIPGDRYPVGQHSYQMAVKSIGECKTAEEYSELCRISGLEALEEKAKGRDLGEWQVVAWSSRMDLAQKEAINQARWSKYCNVQAVAIVPAGG